MTLVALAIAVSAASTPLCGEDGVAADRFSPEPIDATVADRVLALDPERVSATDVRELLAPMPALMCAAAATTRLRVGPGVLNNDLRHPVLVAREAATLDLLSDGRLEQEHAEGRADGAHGDRDTDRSHDDRTGDEQHERERAPIGIRAQLA